MTDAAGAVQAQYAYDTWGQVTKIQGTQTADFQYAGYYCHTRSGLNLTVNRAYNPTIGRWINRDPIGEDGGVNLFGYVENNPLSGIDPSGLDKCGKSPLLKGSVSMTEPYSVNGSPSKPASPQPGLPSIMNPSSWDASSPTNPSFSGGVPSMPPNVDINTNIRLARLLGLLPHPYLDILFAGMVWKGSVWDYKRIDPTKYEDFGNFNYGATGRAMGYSKETLLRMGGLFGKYFGTYNSQYGEPLGKYPYGDSPEDAKNISAGYDYAGSR